MGGDFFDKRRGIRRLWDGLSPGLIFVVLGRHFLFENVDWNQDQKREAGRDEADRQITRAAGEADCAREPHARAGRETFHATARLDDGTRREEGDARRYRLDHTDWVKLGAVIIAAQIGNHFNRDNRKSTCGEGREHIRAQAGRAAAIFAIHANHKGENAGHKHSGQNFRKWGRGRKGRCEDL